jgi:hypothetical protein
MSVLGPLGQVTVAAAGLVLVTVQVEEVVEKKGRGLGIS